jgi:hypothetical protein
VIVIRDAASGQQPGTLVALAGVRRAAAVTSSAPHPPRYRQLAMAYGLHTAVSTGADSPRVAGY